jgi:hypothetical protein
MYMYGVDNIRNDIYIYRFISIIVKIVSIVIYGIES